jgi:PASTA domain
MNWTSIGGVREVQMSPSSRVFAITTETDAIPLANGRGEASYTVSNSSGRSLRGRARVVPLGSTKEAWLSIGGEAERDFSVDGVHQFTVHLAVPREAPAGKYPFRLDVASVQNPDEEFTEGQTVTATVPPVQQERKPILWWLIAAAALALVVVVGGVTAWMFWPPPAQQKVKVPNVVRTPFEQAAEELQRANLMVVKKETKATLEFAPGEVMQQDPAASTSVDPGATVSLLVAGPSVRVPRVKGSLLANALQQMAAAKLFVKVRGDQDKLGQPVVDTSPAGDVVVLEGSEVTIMMPGSRRILDPSVIRNLDPSFQHIIRNP